MWNCTIGLLFPSVDNMTLGEINKLSKTINKRGYFALTNAEFTNGKYTCHIQFTKPKHITVTDEHGHRIFLSPEYSDIKHVNYILKDNGCPIIEHFDINRIEIIGEKINDIIDTNKFENRNVYGSRFMGIKHYEDISADIDKNQLLAKGLIDEDYEEKIKHQIGEYLINKCGVRPFTDYTKVVSKLSSSKSNAKESSEKVTREVGHHILKFLIPSKKKSSDYFRQTTKSTHSKGGKTKKTRRNRMFR